MATRIQLRRDSGVNWTAHNPVLAVGEIGIEVDTGQFKIGDGVLSWDNAPYFSSGGGRTIFIWDEPSGTYIKSNPYASDSGPREYLDIIGGHDPEAYGFSLTPGDEWRSL